MIRNGKYLYFLMDKIATIIFIKPLTTNKVMPGIRKSEKGELVK
jgi:hypothetical protein